MRKKATTIPVNVRYIVRDVDAAVDFYTDMLQFEVQRYPVPGFAALTRGTLRLFLNAPKAGGAGQEMPDGRLPEPGGWNRFQIVVSDIEQTVEHMKERDASFRNDIVCGTGGKQILLEDPDGNLIELFEPATDQ